MIVNHDGGVEPEFFEKLIDAYNRLEQEGEKVFLYFSSQGGRTDIGNAVIDFINRDPTSFHIVGYGSLDSSAFYIFFMAKCTKELIAGTTGLVHKDFYTNLPVTVDFNVLHYDKEGSSWRQAILDLKQRVPFLSKLGLTAKEIADFKEGKNVCFMHTRMLEFLKKQKPNVTTKQKRKRAAKAA